MNRLALFSTFVVGALAAGACSDVTAPPAPAAVDPAAATALTDHSSHSGDGGVTVTANTGSGTVPFDVVACNGDDVAGTADNKVLTFEVSSKKGTLDGVVTLDHLSATGQPSGFHYEATQLDFNASIVAQNGSAFTTFSTAVLRPSGKNPVDTYVDMYTYFVMVNGKPAMTGVSASTRCPTPPAKHSHW